MVTPKELAGYRAGWQRYKRLREQALAERYDKAMARVKLAAEQIKKKFGCRIFLFGSLLQKDKFMEHSDIDLAVSNLGSDVNFWELYSDVMTFLHPFDFDLVELERIDPEVREYVLLRGMEL